MEQAKGTRDLFLETLSKIGCQYELGKVKKIAIRFILPTKEKILLPVPVMMVGMFIFGIPIGDMLSYMILMNSPD